MDMITILYWFKNKDTRQFSVNEWLLKGMLIIVGIIIILIILNFLTASILYGIMIKLKISGLIK